jgi:hypothetical protein
MTSSRLRSWLPIGAIAVLAVAVVLIAGPGASSDAGPAGTLALHRFLARMGLHVQQADNPPAGPGVFVLFSDLRSTDEAQGLLGWVQDGGTLVISDPKSPTLAEANITSPGLVGNYSPGGTRLAAGCVAPETVGVTSLAVDPLNSVWTVAGTGGAGCFPVDGGSFELSDPMGSGRLVALGGVAPFTNALLGQASNARFALQLFSSGPGGTVVFGSAAPPGTAPTGLWALLPLAARVVIVQVAVAVVLFAAYRARRFGKPVREAIAAPVPAGELVDAVGRLYRSSRATAFAGDTMRRFTMRRLRARVGAGGGVGPVDPEELSAVLAGVAGRDPEAVHRLVAGPPPATDEELIALGRELEELRAQVEQSWN